MLLRIVAGIMFIQVGGLKLFGWFGGMPPNGVRAEIMTQAGIGGILEVAGGVLIMADTKSWRACSAILFYLFVFSSLWSRQV